MFRGCSLLSSLEDMAILLVDADVMIILACGWGSSSDGGGSSYDSSG